MSPSEILPAGFEVLQPFVERWAAPTCLERDRRRGSSTEEERRTFFDTAAPLLERALAHLDAKPLAEHDAADKRLLSLMLALSHIQMAVEVHRELEPRHAEAREAMIITRSVTDLT